MKRCGSPSVWHSACTLPEGEHHDHIDVTDRSWRNEDIVRPHSRAEDGKPIDKARQIASRSRRKTTAVYAPTRPRTAAIEPLEPEPGTAKGTVLDFLRMRRGDWVDGHLLIAPETGGVNGTRRVRELRAEGYSIEDRPKPEHPTQHQYRLAPEPGKIL
jgi:hypothetical protein